MRVDCFIFRRDVCGKCEKFAGDKLTFGKCSATKTDIYQCARRRMSLEIRLK